MLRDISILMLEGVQQWINNERQGWTFREKTRSSVFFLRVEKGRIYSVEDTIA